MNIIEALKSGRLFKRQGRQRYIDPQVLDLDITTDDVLAEDWEVQVGPAFIKESVLHNALARAFHRGVMTKEEAMRITEAVREAYKASRMPS